MYQTPDSISVADIPVPDVGTEEAVAAPEPHHEAQVAEPVGLAQEPVAPTEPQAMVVLPADTLAAPANEAWWQMPLPWNDAGRKPAEQPAQEATPFSLLRPELQPQPDLVAHCELASGDWMAENVLPPEEGMAGDPVPYRFRTDDLVTSILLLSFFCVAWVIARSRRFLDDWLKDFLYTRERPNLFTDPGDTVLRGRLFVVFQTCFILGILFFGYTQEELPDMFRDVSPYKILGVSVATCVVFYAAKITAYHFVNAIFFDQRKCGQWRDTYQLSVLALGLGLLPVVLLVVYFDMDFRHLQLSVFVIVGVVKMLLFYKCYRIFFSAKLTRLHIILYFCGLELAPLLLLWRALVAANCNMILIY